MSSYKISGDFFTEELVTVPSLTFTPIPPPPSPLPECTCKSRDFMNRALSSRVTSSPFTLRIMCRTPDTFRKAHDVETFYKNKYKTLRMGTFAQHEMFFKLKSICDCDAELQSADDSTDPTTEHKSAGPTRTSSSSSSSGSPQVSKPESELKRAEPKVAARTKADVDATPRTEPKAAQKVNVVASFKDSEEALLFASQQAMDRNRYANNKIVRTLRQQLSLPYATMREGWIYISESPANPGFLSIQYQADNYPVVSEVELTKCLPDRRVIAYTTVLPNVRRILNLILAELEFYMVDLPCPTCPLVHKDWYHIDIEILVPIIMRWARWMNNAPYNRGNGLLETRWVDRTRYQGIDKIEPGLAAGAGIDHKDTWDWWTDLGRNDPINKSRASMPVMMTRHLW